MSKDESSGDVENEVSTSSGKRRRRSSTSRWDTKPEPEPEPEPEPDTKRRKTRWDSDVDQSQLKMLGPFQCANYMQNFLDETTWDVQVQGLKERLVAINRKLNCSDQNISFNRRNKLVVERQKIISKLIRKHPTFQAPSSDTSIITKKLYIPVKEYPDYNFIGLIIGPRGNNHKRIEKETGSHIVLRGKGASRTPHKHKHDPSDNDDLHVLIKADNQKSVDAAVQEIEKLLNPFNQGWNEYKVSQLKELSEIKKGKTFCDNNECSVCHEKGHMHYACPSLKSTFDSQTSFMAPIPKEEKNNDEKNLFVGYLPMSIDENRLSGLFSPFGKLSSVSVVKDRSTGLSRGYGFVKFEDKSDAAAAIAHVNGLQIDGNMLTVRVAGQQPPSTSSVVLPFSHFPVYPGPVAIPGHVPFLPTFSGGPATVYVPAEPINLPTSHVYMEQTCVHPHNVSFGFSNRSSVSSYSGSLQATSLSSSYKSRFLSPTPNTQQSPTAKLDCPDSGFQAYLTTPVIRSQPSSFTGFPGDPDYVGSQFL